LTQRRLSVLFSLVLLACLGCGGGGTNSVSPAQQSAAKPAPSTPDSGATPQRNVLRVVTPTLKGLKTGAEFDAVLSARCVDELYQGSGRFAYDSSIVRPVSASRGAAIPAGNIVVTKLDAPLGTAAAQGGLDGNIPFAFTGLPDAPGCGRCDGELIRLRFRLIAPPGGQAPVQLINDPQYLQLRGTQGQRLSFDLSTEVAAP
jgi:hypothetical protein